MSILTITNLYQFTKITDRFETDLKGHNFKDQTRHPPVHRWVVKNTLYNTNVIE